jgi:hypothetical protein
VRPIIVTVGPLASASANAICLSQTPSGAGALTINGAKAVTTNGVTTAVLDNPRRVLITTTDTTHTFTITGLTTAGAIISESFLVSAATYSQLDYSVVTSITISGAATGAVTVGTNGIASTSWVRLDEYAQAQVAIQCNVTGTVNYTVQSTLDDPNSPTSPVTPSAVTWVSTSDTSAVGATATVQTNFAYLPIYARVLLNSGSGSVTTTFNQAGVAPY